MPYSSYGKNSMLDHLGTEAVFVSLHITDPGDTGTGEVTGGSPAYARKAMTWGAAAAGAMAHASAPVFDVPAGTHVNYVGMWSAVSGGVFYGSDDVTEEIFAAQGTYTLTGLDIDLNT